MKKTVYVDMDDTICDYTGEYEHIKKELGIKYPQSQYGFYRNLRPKRDALKSLLELERLGYEVCIATRPSFNNPLCYTEKVEWIRYHLGDDWVKRVYIVPDKSKLIGDYLIDDNYWDFNGELIMYNDDDWNWERIVNRLALELW